MGTIVIDLLIVLGVAITPLFSIPIIFWLIDRGYPEMARYREEYWYRRARRRERPYRVSSPKNCGQDPWSVDIEAMHEKIAQ
jgi:hypothetical protein